MIEKQILNRLQNAINYVEDNLYESIRLENAAKAAFMSQSSFYILFFNVLGTTLKDYIRKRRLSLSSCDLLQTDASILEIALKYQFATYESYSRAFKKLFGISPTIYRLKGTYVNAFPRIAITCSNLSEGDSMITMEMNKDLIIKEIHDLAKGHILDIDIDKFDDINTGYGYHIGDKVLIEVPKRVKNVLLGNNLDVDVTRISNDEFVVIIKDKTEEFIKSLSQQIIDAMFPDFVFEDASLNLTVSIGVSSFTAGGSEEDSDIINNVKGAMMISKQKGRNQYTFL